MEPRLSLPFRDLLLWSQKLHVLQGRPPRKVPGRKGMTWVEEDGVDEEETTHRGPPWRAKRRRVVPGSREATRDTRCAEGAKGDPKGASERGVQSYGRPVCSRNELAMLWRNAG